MEKTNTQHTRRYTIYHQKQITPISCIRVYWYKYLLDQVQEADPLGDGGAESSALDPHAEAKHGDAIQHKIRDRRSRHGLRVCMYVCVRVCLPQAAGGKGGRSLTQAAQLTAAAAAVNSSGRQVEEQQNEKQFVVVDGKAATSNTDSVSAQTQNEL